MATARANRPTIAGVPILARTISMLHCEAAYTALPRKVQAKFRRRDSGRCSCVGCFTASSPQYIEEPTQRPVDDAGGPKESPDRVAAAATQPTAQELQHQKQR